MLTLMGKSKDDVSIPLWSLEEGTDVFLTCIICSCYSQWIFCGQLRCSWWGQTEDWDPSGVVMVNQFSQWWFGVVQQRHMQHLQLSLSWKAEGWHFLCKMCIVKRTKTSTVDQSSSLLQQESCAHKGAQRIARAKPLNCVGVMETYCMMAFFFLFFFSQMLATFQRYERDDWQVSEKMPQR